MRDEEERRLCWIPRNAALGAVALPGRWISPTAGERRPEPELAARIRIDSRPSHATSG